MLGYLRTTVPELPAEELPFPPPPKLTVAPPPPSEVAPFWCPVLAPAPRPPPPRPIGVPVIEEVIPTPPAPENLVAVVFQCLQQ